MSPEIMSDQILVHVTIENICCDFVSGCRSLLTGSWKASMCGFAGGLGLQPEVDGMAFWSLKMS
jgi:hypothetical protein